MTLEKLILNIIESNISEITVLFYDCSDKKMLADTTYYSIRFFEIDTPHCLKLKFTDNNTLKVVNPYIDDYSIALFNDKFNCIRNEGFYLVNRGIDINSVSNAVLDFQKLLQNYGTIDYYYAKELVLSFVRYAARPANTNGGIRAAHIYYYAEIKIDKYTTVKVDNVYNCQYAAIDTVVTNKNGFPIKSSNDFGDPDPLKGIQKYVRKLLYSDYNLGKYYSVHFYVAEDDWLVSLVLFPIIHIHNLISSVLQKAYELYCYNNLIETDEKQIKIKYITFGDEKEYTLTLKPITNMKISKDVFKIYQKLNSNTTLLEI